MEASNGASSSPLAITVTVLAPPTVSSPTFTQSTIAAGGTTTASWAITNPNAVTLTYSGLTSLTLPSGVSASSPITGCGVSPTYASDTFTLSGATVSGAGTCTLKLTLTASTVGAKSIPTGTPGASGPISLTGSPGTASTLTVTQASTTTSVASSLASPTEGQSVTFTATITGGASPTGTVNFKDGASSINNCNAQPVSSAQATCTTTALTSAGSPHSITAVYGGDTNNLTSTSSALTQTVNAPAPSLTGSPSATTVNTGSTTTMTASATGAASVKWQVSTDASGNSYTDISDGGLYSGATTTTLSITGAMSLDRRHFRAVFQSSGGSTTSSNAILTVNPAAPTASASLSSGAVPVGGSFNLVLSLSNPNDIALNGVFGLSGNPNGANYQLPSGVTATGAGTINCSGTSTFSNGGGLGQAIWTQVPAGGSCTLTVPLTAASGGTVSFADIGYVLFISGESASGSKTISSLTVNPLTTTTSVGSSLNPSTEGQSVTFTATITGGTSPTGTVNFKDGASSINNCGAQNVSGAQATCTTSALTSAGSPHSITAVYGGDGNNATSTSSALTQTVNAQVATHYSVSAPSTAVAGTPVSVVVTALDSGNATVTGYAGTVHFTSSDGAASLPANTVLTNGTGTFSATLNTGGAQTVTATDTVNAINGTTGSIAVSVTPAVTGVSPGSGPTGGATSVTITGTAFTGTTGAAGVKFGSANATSYTVDSNTQITAVAPSGSAGAVDVTVTNGGLTSAVGVNDKYTYVAAPTAGSLTPLAGPIGGGTTVTVTGTNFVVGATSVTIGATTVPAGSVTVSSATSLSFSTPAHGAGNVSVTVSTAGGTSAAVPGGFTYEAAPTATSLTPTGGPTAGGTTVTVTGTGFVAGDTTVSIGGNTIAAASVTVNTATSLTFSTPSHAAGNVSVAVSTSGGTSSAVSGGYTYAGAPAVTALSPASGSTAGGTSVTITGTDLSGASAVSFGATPATGFSVSSATSITATAPAGSAGVVDVTVTTPGGVSGASSADRFTYQTPLLGLAMTHTGNAVKGGTVSYTVTPSATLSPTSGALTLTWSLPTGVTYSSASGTNWTCTSAGCTSSTAIAAGANGDAVTLVLAYGAASTSPSTPGVSLSGGGAATAATASDATTVGTAAAPTAAITVSPSQVAIGGTAHAVITLTNPNSGSALSAVADVSQFQGGVQLAASPNLANTCGGTLTPTTGGGGRVTLAGGALAASATCTLSFDLTTNSAAGYAIQSGTPSSAESGSGSAGPSAPLATPRPATVAVSLNPTSVAVGQASVLTFTLASDNGIAVISNLGDSVTLPANVVVAPTPATATTCGGTVTAASGASTVVLTGGTLGTNASCTFKVSVVGTAPGTPSIPTGVPTGDQTSGAVAGSSATLTVTHIAQSIGFTSTAPSGNLIATTYTPVATGGASGNPVVFSIDAASTAGACSISAGLVSFTGTGSCIIDANQAGGGNYAAAAQVQQSIVVNAAAPTVSGISPANGPLAGGTTVVVTGANFTAASAVRFGATTAASFTVNSATQITAVSPAASAGAVDVTVTTPGGTSAAALADQFTYVAAPVAGAVTVTVNQNATAAAVTLALSGGTATAVTVSTPATHGVATASGTGITYAPTAGYYGVDSFQYTASNPGGTSTPASVTVTVSALAPTVSTASLSTAYATAVSQDLASKVSGAVNTLQVATAPTGGTVIFNGTTVTYTPNAGFYGSDSFTFTAVGPGGTSAPASVTVTVANPPAPSATAKAVAVNVSLGGGTPNPTAIDLSGSVTNAGGIVISTPPQHGTATVSGFVVTYTPNTGYFGADSFAYQAVGLPGSGSGSALLSLPGGAPVIFGAGGGVGVGSGTALSAAATVSISIAAPTITLGPSALPAAKVGVAYSQTVSAAGGTAPYTYALTAALPAGLSLNASTGVISGTPTAQGVFALGVTVTDSSTGTGPFSATQAYSLTVAGPSITLSPTTLSAAAQGIAYPPVTFTASGGTAPYSNFIVTSGALPTGVSLTTGGVLSGTPLVAGAFNFTVSVTDSTGGTGAATGSQAFSLQVAAAPPPTATAKSATTPANAALVINLTSGDSGLISSVAITTQPSHGTVALSGTTATYTPATNYFGADSFAYADTGIGGTSAPATVSLTVTPLAVPTVKPQVVAVLAGKTLSLDTTSGATGAPYTSAAITTAPATGTATVAGTTITYTAPATFSGAVTIGFTLSNPFGTSLPGTATVTVNPQPFTPAPITVQVSPDKPAQADVTTAATGGPFIAAAIVTLTPASAGTALVVQTGGTAGSNASFAVKFTPALHFSGSAVATYTLSNAYATSAPGTVTFQVAARPDPTQDPDVRGLIQAQTDTAIRFGQAQLANFNQRLETLHHDGPGKSTNGLSFQLGDGPQAPGPEDSPARNDKAFLPKYFGARDLLGGAMGNTGSGGPGSGPVGQGASALRGGRSLTTSAAGPGQGGGADEAGPSNWSVWTGGSIDFGMHRSGAVRSKLKFDTTGISVGADYRLSDKLILGAGLGYGRDTTDIGSSGSQDKATSYLGAVYGSYHPSATTFIDAVLGYGDLHYRSRRYDAAAPEFEFGRRSGDEVFGSITAAWEFKGDRTLISPYGRIDGINGQLDPFTETGGVGSLAYAKQTVRSLRSTLGLHGDYIIVTSEGVWQPRFRVEYQHEFTQSGDFSLQYADWLDGPTYRSAFDTSGRDQLVLGLGADLRRKDLTLSFDWKGNATRAAETVNEITAKLAWKF